MSIVSFDFAGWAARYPELAGAVTPQIAQQYFNEAQLYCDNSPCSPIRDASQRAILLNMVTAHIAALNAPLNGQPSSQIVGRITNAAQGSVSVAAQMDVPPGSAQWFAQTKYGAAFWAATAAYRTMHYMPGPAFLPDPYRPW